MRAVRAPGAIRRGRARTMGSPRGVGSGIPAHTPMETPAGVPGNTPLAFEPMVRNWMLSTSGGPAMHDVGRERPAVSRPGSHGPDRRRGGDRVPSIVASEIRGEGHQVGSPPLRSSRILAEELGGGVQRRGSGECAAAGQRGRWRCGCPCRVNVSSRGFGQVVGQHHRGVQDLHSFVRKERRCREKSGGGSASIRREILSSILDAFEGVLPIVVPRRRASRSRPARRRRWRRR